MQAPALWRVRPYLRPYWPHLGAMLGASVGGVAAAIGVPTVVRRVVDGPIATGDRNAILPLA